MHHITEWCEEGENSADDLITELLNVETSNREVSFNMDQITPVAEEEDQVPLNSTEDLITELFNAETQNREFSVNMDQLTPETGTNKRKSSYDYSPIPKKCPRISVIVPNTDVLRTSVIVQNPNVPQSLVEHPTN